jgi:hypothetical protein
MKWQRVIARGYRGARDTSPTIQYERAAIWCNIPCAREVQSEAQTRIVPRSFSPRPPIMMNCV